MQRYLTCVRLRHKPVYLFCWCKVKNQFCACKSTSVFSTEKDYYIFEWTYGLCMRYLKTDLYLWFVSENHRSQGYDVSITADVIIRSLWNMWTIMWLLDHEHFWWINILLFLKFRCGTKCGYICEQHVVKIKKSIISGEKNTFQQCFRSIRYFQWGPKCAWPIQLAYILLKRLPVEKTYDSTIWFA